MGSGSADTGSVGENVRARRRRQIASAVGATLIAPLSLGACGGEVAGGGRRTAPDAPIATATAKAKAVPKALEQYNLAALLTELRARADSAPVSLLKSASPTHGGRPFVGPSKSQPGGAIDPHLAIHSTEDIAKAALSIQKARYRPRGDSRKEIFDIPDPERRKLASSVAAFVLSSAITEEKRGTAKKYRLRGLTLDAASLEGELVEGYRWPLCDDESFRWQRKIAECTGALIEKDVVLTAGHCFDGRRYNTENIRIVFGFAMKSEKEAKTLFDPGDVYKVKAVLSRGPLEAGKGVDCVGYNDYRAHDTARRVVGDWVKLRIEPADAKSPPRIRTHLTPRLYDGTSSDETKRRIGDTEPVFVIGHPAGLPTKYADDATVIHNRCDAYFKANLDAYGGNSGSPVFNEKNEIVGLLVEGQPDWEPVSMPTGACLKSQVFPKEGEGGEVCLRTSMFHSVLSPR